MQLYKFAIPKLAAYSVLFPLPPALLWIFMTCVVCFGNNSNNWFMLIPEVVGSIVLVVGFIYYYRIAFCPYKMNSQGISNRYVTIDWANVTTYQVYPVQVYVVSSLWKTEIAQVCAIPSTNASSYGDLNPRECVFFSVTKENLLLIEQCCTKKSEGIQDLLLRYSDLLGRPMD